jgi:hypothetical protein
VISARVAQLAVLLLAVPACSAQGDADGGDGAAVAACRGVLADLAPAERLATTVRDEGDGFLVSAWSTGRAEGKADYLCRVERDGDADRGVRVVRISSRGSDGAYSSSLDIELDRG